MVFVLPESGLLLPDFFPDNGRVFFLPDRGLPVFPPDNGLADWAIFEHLRAAETKSDFFDQGYPDRKKRIFPGQVLGKFGLVSGQFGRDPTSPDWYQDGSDNRVLVMQ